MDTHLYRIHLILLFGLEEQSLSSLQLDPWRKRKFFFSEHFEGSKQLLLVSVIIS